MFHLLTFAGMISIIAGLARLNKSNKLFWVFLVSMLIGFAGGSFRTVAKNYTKKENIEQKSFIQGLPVMDSTVCLDLSTGCIENTPSLNNILASNAKPESPRFLYRDTMFTRTLGTFNPDYDIGLFEHFNTS